LTTLNRILYGTQSKLFGVIDKKTGFLTRSFIFYMINR